MKSCQNNRTKKTTLTKNYFSIKIFSDTNKSFKFLTSDVTIFLRTNVVVYMFVFDMF